MGKKFISAGEGLPFSKAVVFGNIVEISGQIGLGKDGELVDGVEAQVRQSLENVKNILNKVGLDLNDLVKVRIFLVDMKDYSVMNKIYSEYFEDGKFPARIALGVKELPLGALVEFDCVGFRD